VADATGSGRRWVLRANRHREGGESAGRCNRFGKTVGVESDKFSVQLVNVADDATGSGRRWVLRDRAFPLLP